VTAKVLTEMESIRRTQIDSWTQDVSADCAVVLTGGPGRIKEGMDLLNQKKVKKLIISGVFANAKLREIMPSISFYGGINEEDIILEHRSTTTFGNAQQSLPLVEALRCRDIVLVTSQIHMNRAYATFRASFPDKISIFRYSILAGRYNPSFLEVFQEAIKSLFYSLWAYGFSLR
jgi:uncharacterized SAM-binding protein YcdF (DUF218 family)